MIIADPVIVISILVAVCLLATGEPQWQRSDFRPPYPNLKRSEENARSANARL
jgi:hypothetical protein